MMLKTNILIPVLFLFFIACSEKSNSQSDKSSARPAEEVTLTGQELEALKDPCKLLSSEDVKSIAGFQESTEGGLHMGSGDTYKQCDFSLTYDNKNAHLTVIFRRSSERQIDAKKLEKDYAFYLKQDGYTSVPNAPSDQAYFNHKKTDVPSGSDHLYSLQLRYGNHTEYQIALSYGNDEKNSEIVLKKLLAIASKLGE